MLTCITAAGRMGTHILHPYLVMRDTLHTLNRSRVEAWWRIHKYNNRSEASRDDIETVVFGSTGSNQQAAQWAAPEKSAVENGFPINLAPQQLEVSSRVHHTCSHMHINFNLRTWRRSNVRQMRGSNCSITPVDFEFQIYRCKPNHARPCS